ncbi:MAG: Hsp20/alpha crystallin family protein, partial [Clostridia bacterium]|nr:Hsp20/alpha crystallin family protein [Clostridia bacterium]
ASSFATDILDTGDSYRLDMELPGFKKDEIKVSLEGKLLTVSAAHEAKEEKDDSQRYLRRERRTGSVTRSFTLSGIDTDGIEVLHENGVLSVILPKTKPIKPEVKEFEIR